MGLLPSLNLFGAPSEADKRATEVRSGAVAPSRAERARCWEARDAYFACLDASGIVDAVKDDKKAAAACGAESGRFEKDCAAQWVGLLFLGASPSFPFGLESGREGGVGDDAVWKRERAGLKGSLQCGLFSH